MARKEPTLDEVIGSLILSQAKRSIKLSRGLRLAYTPATQNDGVHRLVLSRGKYSKPSEEEDRIVWTNLRQALKAQGRSIDGAPSLQPNWAIRGIACTVIQWREYVQDSLF